MSRCKKVLVTGCAGFIGSHLSVHCLDSRHLVYGLDNLSRKGSEYNLRHLQKHLLDNFYFTHADLTDRPQLDALFQKNGPFDWIAHEAGQVAVTTSLVDPHADFEANARATLNLLECIRLHSPEAKLIFASTNKVYGNLDDLTVTEEATRYALPELPEGIDESRPLEFHSPYGCSKGAADQYVCDYAHSFGLRTVAFRQSCIYGTHQFGLEDQGWVAWFLIATALGRPITIYGDGKQVRDLLWIEDLCYLYFAVWNSENFPWGSAINVGGGPENTLSLLELLTLMDDLGIPRPTHTQGNWRKGDQRIFLSNNSKAHRLTGWSPKTDPREGIRRLWHWIQENERNIAQVLEVPSPELNV